jgi:hypothetical protein
MRRALIALLVALPAVLAAPRPAVADDARPPSWQYGLNFGGGAAQIGGLGFAQIGLQLRLARTVAPGLRAAVTADMLNTNRGSGEALVMGETLRGTLGVEWDAGAWNKDIMLAAVTVVAGGGSELITWERGVVSRPLGYLGCEVGMGFRMRSDGRGLRGPRTMGYRFGVRIFAADGIAPDKVPMQSSTSPAARLELAFLGTMGLAFGR